MAVRGPHDELAIRRNCRMGLGRVVGLPTRGVVDRQDTGRIDAIGVRHADHSAPNCGIRVVATTRVDSPPLARVAVAIAEHPYLSLIHISEPTRLGMIS